MSAPLHHLLKFRRRLASQANGDGLYANNILTAIRYPDKITGAASSSEQESYTVDALGEQTTYTDRNGSVHTYAYDVLGRRTSDTVTTLGTGVDGSVRRIETAYNTQGLPYLFTSYDAVSGGNIVNRMQRDYNGLGQVTAEYQSEQRGGRESITTAMGAPFANLLQSCRQIGDGLDANNILTAIEYPDKSTGAASSSEQESYTVDALGEQTTYTDRNGSTHTNTRDVLGRVTADTVTTLGTGVDGSVRRIETAYNTQGLPYLFTSYDAVSGGNIVNQVQRDYNGLGQVTAEYQSHSGAVNTSTTPEVQYAYADPQDGSRLTSITYPDGRVIDYNYATGERRGNGEGDGSHF